MQQPLEMLAQIQAIELTYATKSYMQQKKADWTKLNATQRALIHQIEVWRNE